MKPSAGAGALIWFSMLLCGVALGIPIIGAIAAMFQPTPDAVALAAPLGATEFRALIRSLGVASAISLLSVTLALPAAWSMRWLSARWACLLIVPMLLPSYLIHAAWNLLRAPGTYLGNMLEGGAASTWVAVNHVQAILTLALWSWPIAALLLGAWARRLDQESLDALALAPGSRWRVRLAILHMLTPGLVVAGVVVFLLMLGTAVPLHLAQVDTYAIVIWRRLAEVGPTAQVWRLAMPLIAIAIAAGWILSGRLLRSASGWSQPAHTLMPRSNCIMPSVAVSIWVVSALVPLGLLYRAVPSMREFERLGVLLGESAVTSAVLSACVGGGVGAIAVGAALGFGARADSTAARASSIALRLWIIAALLPGVLIGSAVVSASSALSLDALTSSWLGAGVAHLARFGAIGAIAGLWLARSEPQALSDLRELFSGSSLIGWLRSSGAINAGALIGVGILGMILSLHEIESTVVAAPPGAPSLAERLLSMLHYLRDDQLSAAAFTLGAFGLLMAIVAALGVARTARLLRRLASPGSHAAALALVAILCVGGCERRSHSSGEAAVLRVIGERGRGAAQFLYPRAIDAAADGSLWVVDKAARVQHLSPEGEFISSFDMPAYTKGKPVGLTVGPDGLIYIADTHENRIAVFDPQHAPSSAVLVRDWGSYGDGPGQFIYPTDIAIVDIGAVPDARRYYVSEYGGNDRVSVFDAQYQFLFSFGKIGYSEPQDLEVRFNRPQSIEFDESLGELIVADAANHRLGRFRLDGTLVGWIGSDDGLPGSATGQFSYPYGLASMHDGTIFVAEYGACRIVRVDLRSGARLESFGTPGRAVGELVTPWGVAHSVDRVFVLDSGNDRIQALESPPLASRRAWAP